jgi:hypothetical protein
MIPEIPDRYWSIVRIVLAGVFVLTALSMFLNFEGGVRQRAQTLQLEMSKKSYCLRPVLGSNELQYQPCDMIIRMER